jgi:hypothetical protein
MTRRSLPRHMLIVAAIFLPPMSLAALLGWSVGGFVAAFDYFVYGAFVVWFLCSLVGILTEFLIDKGVLPPPRD